MEDYIHMYDIVGQHEGASSIQWKCTDTNGGRNAYTLPKKFQQAPNEYQEPLHRPCHEHQQDKAQNVEAVDTSKVVNEQNTLTFSAVKQCSESSPGLKKIKRCLCVLTFLLIISLLISAAAGALAVYDFLGVTNTNSIASQNQLMTTDVDLTLRSRLTDLEKNLNESIQNTTSIIEKYYSSITDDISAFTGELSATRTTLSRLQHNTLHNTVKSGFTTRYILYNC